MTEKKEHQQVNVDLESSSDSDGEPIDSMHNISSYQVASIIKIKKLLSDSEAELKKAIEKNTYSNTDTDLLNFIKKRYKSEIELKEAIENSLDLNQEVEIPNKIENDLPENIQKDNQLILLSTLSGGISAALIVATISSLLIPVAMSGLLVGLASWFIAKKVDSDK